MAGGASPTSKTVNAGWCHATATPSSGSGKSRKLYATYGAKAILDGEIACVDDTGLPQFNDLMFGSAPARFFAFDVLFLDGEDLRDQPCVERKKILQERVNGDIQRLHYVEHIAELGEQLFDQICERDMEGIVAKPKDSPYREIRGKTPWRKIKNPDYSQVEGRGELFQQDR